MVVCARIYQRRQCRGQSGSEQLKKTELKSHTSAFVSIRQQTSAYVSIRQHTSAYVSILWYSCMWPHVKTHQKDDDTQQEGAKKWKRSRDKADLALDACGTVYIYVCTWYSTFIRIQVCIIHSWRRIYMYVYIRIEVRQYVYAHTWGQVRVIPRYSGRMCFGDVLASDVCWRMLTYADVC